MYVKYEMCVDSIGTQVGQFLEKGILVFFQVGAPEELSEFSILHTHTDLKEVIKKGDYIKFGRRELLITGVGEVANKNLEALGHLILKNNGFSETELPGDISVEEKPFPAIYVGDKVQVISKKANPFKNRGF
jgi:PTS system glucitol/sorbitol-specific IIA component